MLYRYFIIRAENEAVFLCHISGNPEFGIDIVLHLIAVSVEMVRGNVEQYGDIRLEFIHSVKLETTYLKHVNIVLFSCYLKCVTLADITTQTHIQAGIFKQIVNKRCGSGLAVAAGNTDLPGIVISAGKLNFRNNGYAAGVEPDDQGCSIGNAGTFYHFISNAYLFNGVSALLIGNSILHETRNVFFLKLAVVREKYVKSLDFRQDCSSGAALSTTQYNDSFHSLLPYL